MSEGDSLTPWHLGSQFSTLDEDNDAWSRSCAESYGGGWWYYACAYSNLNGRHQRANGAGVVYWWYWSDDYHPLKSTQMKIRPT